MKKLVITLLIMGMSVSMVSCANKETGKEINDNNIVVDIEKDKENSDKEKSPITIKDSNENKEENKQEEKNESSNEQGSIESNNINDELVKEEQDINQSTEDNQSESQEVTRNCRLFFYNGVEDVIYYKDTVVEVIDKAVTKALTNGLKSSAGANFLALPSNVEVLSAKLDGDSITVNLSNSYYDFSSGLGSSAEIGMLNSLALTYSYNYNVNNIRILVNGQNYESGHLFYGDNDYINIESIETKAL
ncbi:Spore germination protein [uncultured Clostridium sp.]|uniref:GerMN domain-containing protein n=1 Tax=uncultured Clostridium sp. TaxID=59620 RepID=UPI000821F294|nr:GerMN domain-containing protein [uncultured Clostridium sp.]SCK02330.1 Spore germination protein [uncultured Clostridium sp.]